MMDRSRRATNAENYDAAGVPKKGASQWKYSKRYEKLRRELSEIFRLERETRRTDHGLIANTIIQLGGTVKCERNSHVAFQKNFGKSVGRNGTASLIQRVRSKAESAGGTQFVELNAYRCRLFQYDHVTAAFAKKPLGQRWTRVGNTVVQRDAYSAFLAMCVVDNEHNPRLLRRKVAECGDVLEACRIGSGFQSVDGLRLVEVHERAGIRCGFLVGDDAPRNHPCLRRQPAGNRREAASPEKPKSSRMNEPIVAGGNPRLFTAGSLKKAEKIEAPDRFATVSDPREAREFASYFWLACGL